MYIFFFFGQRTLSIRRFKILSNTFMLFYVLEVAIFTPIQDVLAVPFVTVIVPSFPFGSISTIHTHKQTG